MTSESDETPEQTEGELESEEIQNEALEVLRLAEEEIEREGEWSNGGPSSEGLVH